MKPSVLSRKFPLISTLYLGMVCVFAPESLRSQPIELKDPLQLFTDDCLIEKLSGEAQRVLQKPQPKEVVFTTDAPWEGNTSAYFTVFQDGDVYRMYYRGSDAPEKVKAEKEGDPSKWKSRPETTCVAESRDGVHWIRPTVNEFPWKGSKENNIIWMGSAVAHNFTPFIDENPVATSEARYKAVGGKGHFPRGLKSADGLHWSVNSREVFKVQGKFDSQNLAFWDTVRNEYRMYWRIYLNEVRGIRTATSKDFATWENETDLIYPGKADPDVLDKMDQVHFYTNAVRPYFRAPHLFIGFPTQYIPRGKQDPPKLNQTQPLFMSSRDGVRFELWDEPIIPTTAPSQRAGNRGNYMAWGLVQLPGQPKEMSVYATEAGHQFGPTRLRRFVYRLDGFVSVYAGAGGGELLTKPLVASGTKLVLNYRTGSGGSVRVELQDADGKPLEGFRLEDCEPLTGDSINAVVKWKGNSTLKTAPAGLRMRFVLQDADLFSMKL